MNDWIWWWNFGFPTLVGGALLWSSFVQNQRRLELWRETLASCRLTEEESSGFFSWRAKLTARSGPLEVRIADVGGKGTQIKVVIEGPEGFSALELRRQVLKLWADEIEIGDEDFDDAFLIEGPIRPLCARLDADMRRQLVRASAACNALEIGGGQLRVEVSEETLPRILPLLLYISRQLAQPADVERQIAKNARHDPKAGVRLFNLLLLIRERPGDPETLRALRRACSDASPEIRLRAALELGEEGDNALLKLAESSSDDASCAQAVSHLGGRLPLGKAKNILSSSLQKGLFETARACLEVLGHYRDAAVGVLEKVMTEEKGELAAAAALALGKTGEAAAERPLLQALRSEDSDLREAAVTALGRVGSVAAVQPLLEAAEGSLFDLFLRQAARQAVAEIQSRLDGASPGQISLAEAEAGQLSLAPDEAGQLSLAPDEAGPFPPPDQRLRN
ncbi:MAG TPA: HEAT repeat domain-containing protein [Thermoanaerobaculia bacterium]|nr:HEAT repeat domain-containing protein [Thermoanaerobaculia bacterium]